ncbi:thioredoxin family protein [Paenibacillus sp. PL91]|uniref:thioredoxin family protein n=1 Tax=Paenibacillus sp. PL91 TaxID=2729538 RepID=UPI00145E9EDF|nr:thioredoxin domain-containing protein [Paenibacillus sp. PL91]MBC9204248.1 thiol reductase thioredoxin [Paenibacillus sp. PL91]
MAIMNAESDSMLKSIVSEGVVLVDYGAPWCPPCKTLLGILDELDQEMNGRVGIIKVNCEDLPASASEAGVLGMPTVIVYKDGQPMDKLVGLRPKSLYQAVVEKYL